MKVLITGGAGYIGTELTYRLAQIPQIKEIIIYDNLSRGNYNLFIGQSKLNHKISFVHADILDTITLKKHLRGVDMVYHLAAKVTTPFADHNVHQFEQINNWGTAELVYAVEESEVKKFVYLSSASVYGSSSELVQVGSPLNPKSFYGISKMRGEEHVSRLLEKDVTTYIIRCGNVFGYNKSMRFDSVVNRFLFAANFKKLIQVNGDGKQHRSFIHVDKTGDILSRLPVDDLEAGIYDLVEDTLSINFIADAIKELYPELEMIYINQNNKMRELKVKQDPRIFGLTDIPIRSLIEVLRDFKVHFSW